MQQTSCWGHYRSQASEKYGYISVEHSDDYGNINAQGDICVFPELVTKLVNCDGGLDCTGKPNGHNST